VDQVRVNLIFEKENWQAFSRLVPQRKKSQTINKLLKKESESILRQKEQMAFPFAFEEASRDPKRLKEIHEWASLDSEEWK
jgi:hypothetical protein